MHNRLNFSKKNISYGLIAVLALVIIFVTYLSLTLSSENKSIRTELQNYASSTAIMNEKIVLLQSDLDTALISNAEKDRELGVILGDLVNTQEDLRNEEAKIGLLTDQVTSITNVVGVMEKLATTDEELLQKYSKVYFLNEHYIPENLVIIEDGYAFEAEKRNWFHKNAYEHLKQMIITARLNGMDISVISAYRSFYSQGDLKNGYTVTYGQGANTFSADQGYSEHQLGTTVDLTDSTIGAGFEGFGNTVSYSWLQSNAHKYGFVLSYPKGNEYYIFEPWHWRFVGIALATKLHNEAKTFYGEEQRVIDKYLVSIFDTQ